MFINIKANLKKSVYENLSSKMCKNVLTKVAPTFHTTVVQRGPQNKAFLRC